MLLAIRIGERRKPGRGTLSRGHDGAASHRGSGRPLRMADFSHLLVWQTANKLSVATAEGCVGSAGHAGSILRRQLLRSTSAFRPALRRAAQSEAIASSRDTYGLR